MLAQYDRVYVSHCILGSRIKLSPSGKWYTVLTIGGPRGKWINSIILEDENGKTKQVAWDRVVCIPANLDKYEDMPDHPKRLNNRYME
jgi:hypothetical protein